MPTDSPAFPGDSAVDLVALFQDHAAGLAGCVRSCLGSAEDPRDLLQEAFANGWRALEKGTRPVDPVAWSFVLVLNLARDEARRRGRRATRTDLDEVEPMELQTKRSEPDRGLLGGEVNAALAHALTGLTEAERSVVLLRLNGDCTFERIADALAIPVGTAKTRMRAGLAKLRQALAGFDPRTVDGTTGETL